jgi:CheY-like chemotaxis protein
MHLESQPGFAIEEAADGVEAIEKAAKALPDLIVLDLALPRMNGLQVAAALKGGSKHIPIILFTSYQDVVKEQDARTLGISAVVSKSSSIEVLLNEIQRLVPATRSASA